VHVCRRWRQLILASPSRLNLQLLCTRKTPVRKNLDFWPAIPIAVCDELSIDPTDEDNIFAALEYRNRICNVSLRMTRSQLEKVALAMQEPFPALSHLRISLIVPPSEDVTVFSSDESLPSEDESPPSEDESPPSEDESPPSEDEATSEDEAPTSEGESPPSDNVLPADVLTLPDGFLGGNASSLQKISFAGISFPALPALLLSANNLISLRLGGVFNLFAPGTLAAGLAATTRLEDLSIKLAWAAFPLPKKSRSAPPPSRVVLPALTRFQFHGDYTYIEYFVAQIDCPQLRFIDVMYADELTRSSQLIQFIGRSEALKLAPFRRARVKLGQESIDLDGSRADPHPSRLKIEFPSGAHELRDMRKLLVPASAMLTTVHHLFVHHYKSGYFEHMLIADWITFFRLFPAVETLHFGRELATRIDPVFNELTVAGVLPALRFLSVGGPPRKSVLQFVSARQASGCPVTLVKTREEFKMHEVCCETVGVVDKHTV
jgi:hypothetical protein